MPLVGFICPDGVKTKINDCLTKCRMNNPCRSMRYLLSASADREYQGKPSCTQLLNGTRMEYLKIVKNYYIRPDDRAYAILGTRTHWRLDKIAKSREELISEYKLDGDQTGILDCLEPDRVNGGYRLIDNKTWGSYATLKAINGDMFEAEMQLNFYRTKATTDPVLNEILGTVNITGMFIEVIVRDGGTISAIKNNITERIYTIQVRHLDDNEVMQYFINKHIALERALQERKLPPVCSITENWNWRRCKAGLCEVYEFCPEGRQINRLSKLKT